uniref:Transmembrane protein 256 n=1 Tax=Bigelowiella natans TaxID=227086 RepID=A0A6U3GPF4_BIGNA|mmetsp:Transcript_10208/g.12174  ORF Transcript_10208/g.12174 Transcript_10208/m.12174 type:complete len:114 (+) Transcript_10208:11-352(+)
MPLSKQIWFRVGGLSGALSVGAAAYGAHGFQTDDEALQKSYDNGKSLHMIHSAMIAIAPITRRPHLVGTLFTAGTGIFSGSCYAKALTGEGKYGQFAPIGGTTLILAWLALVL